MTYITKKKQWMVFSFGKIGDGPTLEYPRFATLRLRVDKAESAAGVDYVPSDV